MTRTTFARWPAVVLLLLAPGSAAAQWQATTTELLQREKTGFGGLSGVVVDHRNGDVYVVLSDRGLFRSPDQGKTWQSLRDFKGRTEWPGCLMLDPVGNSKKLVTALVYGAPILVSPDGGSSWRALDKKSSHVDWCAVDWSDPDMKFVLTLKHEAGDLLLASRDGGDSFVEVGKGYGPAWVFDAKTAVVAEAKSKAKPKPGLLRTTDAAQTFQPCAAYSTKALPRWRDGTLYWVVDGALVTTRDKGVTWEKRGDLKDGRFGPIFGKDAQHLFVLAGGGIIESRDGGATWSKALPVPKELKGVSALTWMEYDPGHDVLYVMKMGSQLYRLERGR